MQVNKLNSGEIRRISPSIEPTRNVPVRLGEFVQGGLKKSLLNRGQTQRSCRGVTLIELMVTLAVAAIVMGIAIPSFDQTIRSNRLTSFANEWVSSLNFARSEAIKRNVPVSIVRKSATAKEWEDGWDIFVDFDEDGVFDDDSPANPCESGEDCLLKTYYALSSGYSLRSSGDNEYKNFATYLAGGLSKHQVSETFRLCDNTQDTGSSRTININVVGRPNTGVNNAASCP